MPALLSLVFFLSGAAALLFETLWFNQAGLALGNSVWASSVVLAGFMGGLGIGNGLAGRYGGRIAQPLRVYALLELAIGVTGVALTYGLPHLGPLLAPVIRPVLDDPVKANAIRLACAFALLLVPSTAMGGTLPLLVGDLARRDPRFGRVLGRLYGWNTLGAVVGAVAGHAALFAWLGIRGSALAAAALNATVALLAFGLSRAPTGPIPPESSSAQPRAPLPGRVVWILLATFLCGGSLLALEVVWFRFLILFTLPGSLAFALMLGVVLAGIALGGLAAGRVLGLAAGAERGAAVVAAASAILCVLTYAGFDPLVSRVPAGAAQEPWAIVMLGGALMFPVSFCSGALFALIGEALNRAAPAAVRSAGLLTLANTTGAMLGSLVGGFLLLPGLGIERSVRVVAAVYAATAILLALSGLRPARQAGRVAAFLALAGCAAALGPLFPTALMERRYLAFPLRAFTAGGERPVAVRESLTETIVYTRWDVLGEPAHYRLVTNTHSMSTTSFKAQRYMRLFVYLPVALLPAPKDALLISYGVGVTAKALTDTKSLERIDVVDVSRDILDMNRIAWGPGEYPLDDPRVHVHIEDGRQFLQVSDRKYDLITGEPPPPKAAGIVSLYTKEFFALAKSRLRPGGILSYWLPVHLFTEGETRSIVRAFCDAFDDCSLWSGGGLDWILLGTNGAAGPGSDERFAAQWADPVVAPVLRELGFERPGQLGATFMGDARDLAEIAGDALPLDDDHPKRLGQAMLPMAGQLELYRSWLEPGKLRARFERSQWIARIWPPGARAATLPLFALQDRIEDYFATGLGEPARPEEDLPRVDRVLRETPLETLALWEMRLSGDVQRALQRAAAKGVRDPLIDFAAGARALAARRFAEAAASFEAARAAAPADRTPLYYELYALCRAGRRDESRALAARMGVPAGKGPADRRVWAFLDGQCAEDAEPPLGAGASG